MNSRKPILLAVVALGVLTSLSPARAIAAQTHGYRTSFSAPGSGAAQLSLAAAGGGHGGSGLAINAASGDVYVADTGNNRIDQFSASGAFVRAWGWGVIDGSSELQTCTELTGCRAGLSGHQPGELEAPTFIAVDNSPGGEGAVYVSPAGREFESPKNLVTKFDSEGNLIESWGVEGQLDGSSAIAEGTGNLTAGSNTVTNLNTTSSAPFEVSETISGTGIPADTQIIVVSPTTLTLSKFATATGSGVALTTGSTFGPMGGLAVGSSGQLWVYTGGTLGALGNHVYEFARNGSFLKSVSASAFGGFSPQGLAIDDAGDLYLGENAVSVYKVSPDATSLGLRYAAQAAVISAFALNPDPAAEDLYVDEGTAIQDVSARCQPSVNGCPPTQTFGAPQLDEAAGLALAPDGTLYAANTGANQIAVFKVSLEATIAPPSEVHATSATVNGEVDPKGGEVTRCFFRTGKTTSYGHNLPCLDSSGNPIGTEADPITIPTEVHADLQGLEGGSTYHVTLRAFNTAEEEVTSEDEVLETSPIPVISEATSTEVTASSATLGAKVNPEGLEVEECNLEYGTSTAYGTTIPCEPSSLPAGASPVPVAAHLAGLSPNITYHWRIVAENANGAATGADNTFVFSTESPGSPAGSCANEALRQANGSLALPECRAYELVDPPQKNGALLAPVIFGLRPSLSAEGSRLIVSSLQCFVGAQSCTGDRVSKGPPFQFERTESGWVAHPLAPPASEFELNSVWGYSADSGQVLYSSPVPSGVTDEFYARAPGGAMGGIGPIAESDPFPVVAATGHSASGDLSHVIYESGGSLWAFDASKGGTLYEYAGLANPHPFLVGVSGGPESTDLISACGTSFNGENSPSASASGETLSADGHTAYFTANACSTGSGANAGVAVPAQELYARIDGEGSEARTVQISARSATECSGSCSTSEPEAAQFQGASGDGSAVYFRSRQQLTDEATQGSSNLYLYQNPQQQPLTGSHLIDVSAGDTSGFGPGVEGVMATSADGSHTYFVARGVLAGANAEGNSPTEGADNLYLYQRGEAFPAGHTTFIATLPGLGTTANGEFAETAQWAGTHFIAANITPDGRFLLFTSHDALTPDATRPEGPLQVYRYDSQTEELLRVSIGQRGFNDNGNAGSGEGAIAHPESYVGQSRRDPSMSEDGSRIFFQSPVGLTPGALDDVSVNGRHQSGDLARNIYEWQAPGTGECQEASGCIALISDGQDTTETSGGMTASTIELLGASTSGKDVFFTTADPLVPADTDTGYDIYDARSGGGFAAPSEPVPCQGDACKGAATQAGAQPSPGTPTFDGPGNQKPKSKHHKHKKKKKAHKHQKRAANANRGGHK